MTERPGDFADLTGLISPLVGDAFVDCYRDDDKVVISGMGSSLCEVGRRPVDSGGRSSGVLTSYEDTERALTVVRPESCLVDDLFDLPMTLRQTAYDLLVPGAPLPDDSALTQLVQALADCDHDHGRPLPARPSLPVGRAESDPERQQKVRRSLTCDWVRIPAGDRRFPMVRALLATAAVLDDQLLALCLHDDDCPAVAAVDARLDRVFATVWRLASESAPADGMTAETDAEELATTCAAGPYRPHCVRQ